MTERARTTSRLHVGVVVAALAVYLIGALSNLVALGVHEGPDEPGHLDYAFRLACNGERPYLAGEAVAAGATQWDESSMGHHPPLYYWLLVAVARASGRDVPAPIAAADPARVEPDGNVRANNWLHGYDEVAPLSDEVRTHRLLRAVSVACGLISLVLLLRTARVLLPAHPAVASTAVVLLATLPQWQSSHAVLDNGTLGTTLCFAALALLATLWMRAGSRARARTGATTPAATARRHASELHASALRDSALRDSALRDSALRDSAQRDSTELVSAQRDSNQLDSAQHEAALVRWREALLLGLLIGAALATKLTALFLGPIALLVATGVVVRARDRRRALIRCGVAAALALAIFAPFVIENLERYGEPLATAAHRRAYAVSLVPDEWRTLYLWSFDPRSLFPSLGRSLVGTWGWNALAPPPTVVAMFGGAAGLGLLGVLGLPFVRRWRSCARALVLPAAAAGLVLVQVVLYNATFHQPQGRYLFPGIGGAALVIASGLTLLGAGLTRALSRTAGGVGGGDPMARRGNDDSFDAGDASRAAEPHGTGALLSAGDSGRAGGSDRTADPIGVGGSSPSTATRHTGETTAPAALASRVVAGGAALALAFVSLRLALVTVPHEFTIEPVADPLHANVVARIAHPPDVVRSVVRLGPDDGSTHTSPPTLRWSFDPATGNGSATPGERPASTESTAENATPSSAPGRSAAATATNDAPPRVWTVHLWLHDGTYLGDTYGRLGAAVTEFSLAIPDGVPIDVWNMLPIGTPIRWQVRAVANRLRGESVDEMPHSDMGSFVRVADTATRAEPHERFSTENR